MLRKTHWAALFALVCLMCALSVCAYAAAMDMLTGDGAYITGVTLDDYETGSAPWDKDNDPGNDKDADNGIVRSFDMLTYTLRYNMSSHSSGVSDSMDYRQARACFAFVLPVGKEKAEFDLSSMQWLDVTPGYEAKIVEEDGKQILYCSRLMQPADEGGYVIPGWRTAYVNIFVKGMKQGETLQPTFYCWLEGNDVYLPGSAGVYDKVDFDKVCATHKDENGSGIAEIVRLDAPTVTVSSALKLNVQITPLNSGRLDTYNFNVGNTSGAQPAVHYSLGSVTGTATQLSFMVQLYNKSGRGMRGLEYPDGSPITFDLKLDTTYAVDGGDYKPASGKTSAGKAYDFSALLYSYGGYNGTTKNEDGRSPIQSNFSVPINRMAKADQWHYSCYNGGTVVAQQEGDVVHVTISDYAINGTFPYTHAHAVDKSVRYFGQHVGVISAGELYFIVPHYNVQEGGKNNNNADYIAQMLGSGTFRFGVKDVNLTATSVSGTPLPSSATNTNQSNTGDDSTSITARLDLPGKYSNSIFFGKRDVYNQHQALTKDCADTGADWAFVGSDFGILCGIWQITHNNMTDNRVIAYDDFVKFDASAMELTDDYTGGASDSRYPGLIYQTTESVKTYPYGGALKPGSDGMADYYLSQTYPITQPHISCSMLYAVKTDGQNWDDEDDMRMALPEDSDLVFYETIPQAQEHGVIVGVLLQVRGEITALYPRAGVYMRFKDDPDLVGNSYMICDVMRVWNWRGLNALNLGSDEALAAIPVRTAQDKGYASDAQTLALYLQNTCMNIGNSPAYYKREYTSASSFIAERPSGKVYGDTVYLLGYQTGVTIEPCNAEDKDGAMTYDLDNGQRVADFVVDPDMALAKALAGETSSSAVTNIRVDVTLPDGMTYINGSAYWGGTYRSEKNGRQGTVTGGLQLKENNVVTFPFAAGGKETEVGIRLTPQVNAGTGKTTLTFEFIGVPMQTSAADLSALRHDLYFSTSIENRSANQWTLEQKAVITGDLDHRTQSAANGNLSTSSIVVLQAKSEGIGGGVEQTYYELNSEMGWNVVYSNNSQSTNEHAMLMSVLPTSGYSGECSLSVWQLDLASAGGSAGEYALYYTTDPSVSGKDAGDYTQEQVASGWQRLMLTTVTVDGRQKLVPQNIEAAKNASAWVLIGPLPGSKAFSVSQKLKASGNEIGDSYQVYSSFRPDDETAMVPTSYATSYIVGRSISGRVFSDADWNGVRAAGDVPVAGVTVSLYVRSGNGYVPLTRDAGGRTVSPVTTGSDGTYRFDRLPQGDYRVVFSGDALASYHSATAYHASGAAENVNSDAVSSTIGGAFMTQVSASKPDITLSSIDDFRSGSVVMSQYRQVQENWDLGLREAVSLTVSKAVTGDTPPQDESRSFAISAQLTFGGAVMRHAVSLRIGSGGATSVTPDASGKVSFSLKKGETAVLSGIPKGTVFTLGEDEAAGYTPSFEPAAQGRLDADGQISLINAYSVTPITYAPKVKKTLTGETPPTDGQFTFTLTPVSNPGGGSSVTAPKSLGISGSGEAAYDAITYTRAGTYTYTIEETDGGSGGYTYDVTPWTLTVVIRDAGGALEVESVSYARTANGAQQNASQAEFTNAYDPVDTGYEPQVTKNVTGETPPANETFAFTIREVSGPQGGAQMPQDTQIEITGSGSGRFDRIGLTKAGTYVFEIAETAGSAAGYTYDVTPWTLTLEVTDNGGMLDVSGASFTRTVNGENKSAGSAEFTNVYSVTPITYAPKVKKTLTGETPARAATFDFTLKEIADAQNGAQLPAQTTVSITGAGEAQYGEITFVRAGTYAFEISETQGGAKGYVYDNSKWKLDVAVEDKGGRLEIVNVSYTAAGGRTAQAAEFTNHFSVSSVQMTPVVHKRVEGSVLHDETYTFSMRAQSNPGEGMILPREALASVTGEGEAAFAPVTFIRRGTYELTFTENAGGNPVCDYDAGEWKLTVVVTEEDSVLKVSSAVYSRGGQEGTPVFTNAYRMGSLLIEKQAIGDLAEQDRPFTFILTLTDETGAAVDGEFAVEGDVQGTIASGGTLLLTHEQQAIVTGLPAGAVYTVEDVEANTEGYLSYCEAAQGEIEAGVQAQAVYTNHRQSPKLPGTGDMSAMGALAALMTCSAAALAWLRRKKR